jgi:hypothetical protein
MSSEDMEVDEEDSEPLMQAIPVPNEAHQGENVLNAGTKMLKAKRKSGCILAKNTRIFLSK